MPVPTPDQEVGTGPAGTGNRPLSTVTDPSEDVVANHGGAEELTVVPDPADQPMLAEPPQHDPAGHDRSFYEETVLGGPADVALDGTGDSAKRGLWAWFEAGHWLGKWRTPLLVRLWRYGAGSVLAFVTSGVALFICIQWAGLGATTAAVIAFVAGALPNWILNRRWAWEKRHREGLGRETSLYVIVSLVSLGVSVAVTKASAVAAEDLSSATVRHLLVTGMYLLATVALAGAKYLAYDRWVFVDRRDSSRAQVRKTTEVKRTP